MIFRPTQSLIAIAVLLGVLMIVSGVFHIVRWIEGREQARVWRGIVGGLFVLGGMVLIRHPHLTLALIGLFIGFTWVIQGIAALMEGIARRRSGAETGWTIFFGIISVIAGIVVVSSPIASVAALTLFMGAWFIVMGLLEMFGALVSRRAAARGEEGRAGQRSRAARPGDGRQRRARGA